MRIARGAPSVFGESSDRRRMRRRGSYKSMQCVARKGQRGPVGQISRRDDHRRENGSGKCQALQDARGCFQVVLSIATRTARHVRLIGHRYCSGRRRYDGFTGCRKHDNRNCDQNRQDCAYHSHTRTIRPGGAGVNGRLSRYGCTVSASDSKQPSTTGFAFVAGPSLSAFLD